MTAMFSFDSTTGRINEARQLASPNCDDRPATSEPELIVVHGISLPPGEYGGPWIDQLFTNKLPPDSHPYFSEVADMRVSSHFLIRRDGELVQYVPLGRRAWHAGQSCYDGRESCNDFSVGIELEGVDTEPYEQLQYERLADLIKTLRNEVASLRDADIVGHSDIAPGRKTDPGEAFEWPLLKRLLGAQDA